MRAKKMRFALSLLLPLVTVQSALGAQVGTVRGPDPSPGTPYVLHAVVPTDASVTGPVYVGNRPTESRLIGRTLTHNYHEVWALVGNGSVGPFPVKDVGRRPRRDFIDPKIRNVLQNPNAIVLEITDDQGTSSFPLTGPSPADAQWEVNNKLAVLGYEHVDLGRFGAAQVWVTLRPGLKQIDFIMNWHTGQIGQGDVLFNHARIRVPGGVRWITNLPDPVSGNGYLVKPTGNGLPHIVPQRHDRSFRFSAHLMSRPYTPPWAWNGMADWSGGGVPVTGFATPDAVSGVNVDSDANWWRNGLVNLSPVYSNQTPVSPMWPAMGSHYGGATGGTDMMPFEGVRWLVTGRNSGFERYVIEQLRGRSRMRGCIVEPDGSPVKPWNHLENGQANWRMYNSYFQSSGGVLRDGPFQYPTQRLLSQAAYNPEVFDPTDGQHLVREWNQNAALAMASADPLAMHYIKMEAAKSLMTFWPGPGQANRFGNPPPAGSGSTFNRDICWATMVIAHNYVYADDAERAQYDLFIRKFVDYLEAGQMASGLFQINPNAKEAKSPPFSDGPNSTPNYLISSGLEESYLAAALGSLGAIHPHAASRAPAMFRDHARGFRDLAWAEGRNGVWSYSARGPAGSSVRYVTREDWPQSLRDLMNGGCQGCPYNDTFHIGYAIALHKTAGAPAADELLRRYTNRSTVAAGVTAMQQWGTGGGGVPIEQFWPAIKAFGSN